MTWPAYESCGVRIDVIALDEVAELIATRQVRGDVHLCNSYTLSLAERDRTLAATLEHSSLNLPDGMPLIWIARWLGLTNVPDRVYGPDLMRRVLDLGAATGVRHFLLGSTERVLTALAEEISRSWPHATIVGRESPEFTDDLDLLTRAAPRIRELGADIVWVGLGTPKQDLVSATLARQVPGTVVAVGAAFDFLAGTKRQAPVWMQRRGLEWSFRLATEPARLWRRYVLHGPRFAISNVRNRPSVLRRTSD